MLTHRNDSPPMQKTAMNDPSISRPTVGSKLYALWRKCGNPFGVLESKWRSGFENTSHRTSLSLPRLALLRETTRDARSEYLGVPQSLAESAAG